MAKGDDLYSNAPQNQQINQNALMGRGGMEQQNWGFNPMSNRQGAGGWGFNPLARTEPGSNMMPSLMPSQQRGSSTGNSGFFQGVGNPHQGQAKPRGGGFNMPSAVNQGRRRAQESIDRNSQRFQGDNNFGNPQLNMQPRLFGAGAGENMQLPNQMNDPRMQMQQSGQYLGNPQFLQSLMGGQVPMRSFR